MGTNKDYVIKQIGTYWSHDILSLYKIWTCLVELFLSYSRNNPTSTNIWKVLSLTVNHYGKFITCPDVLAGKAEGRKWIHRFWGFWNLNMCCNRWNDVLRFEFKKLSDLEIYKISITHNFKDNNFNTYLYLWGGSS